MIVFPLFFILYLLPQSSLRKGFTIVLALVTAIGLIYFWYKETIIKVETTYKFQKPKKIGV